LTVGARKQFLAAGRWPPMAVTGCTWNPPSLFSPSSGIDFYEKGGAYLFKAISFPSLSNKQTGYPG
jgi:hypothetical protein